MEASLEGIQTTEGLGDLVHGLDVGRESCSSSPLIKLLRVPSKPCRLSWTKPAYSWRPSKVSTSYVTGPTILRTMYGLSQVDSSFPGFS
ncbi:hypothetical protein LIER_26276 [Lithospermum erythrorhizon]|uniref:Uncharacterized protein n=1 Tax=Lithospermum erythrorhizon TaxID=34254 RepID=A0AAV3R9V1_LITER